MTEITPTEETPLAQPSPMQIIATVAADPNCDVDKLERLVGLQERMAANESQAAYADALAAFQADCPLIVKTQEADRYKYASHAFIMERIKPLLAEHGLSVTFSSEHLDDGRLKVNCKVAHGSYSEISTFTCPVPKVPGANETQQMGAGLSYAMKYALVSALNISVGGEDCDGAPMPNPAPDADPDAPGAATRGTREVLGVLFTRWLTDGRKAEEWWAFVAQVLGTPKAEADLTDDDLDKIAVAIGEIESA